MGIVVVEGAADVEVKKQILIASIINRRQVLSKSRDDPISSQVFTISNF